MLSSSKMSDSSEGDAGVVPTHRVESRAPHRTVARLHVKVVSGADQGMSADASDTELSVGTDAGNDLVLTDRSVSRHHLSITMSKRGAHVRDLSSTNGTRIAGVDVVEAYVQPGSRIELGFTVLELFEHGVVTQALAETTSFADVLGESSTMRRLFAQLPRVAATDSTVLLTGETGCGKSLIARAIHRASARRDGPFVIVDCGAIPPSLIESELFGHVKGAFTGAHRDRLGAFRSAHGGTVLLEEVGELPMDLQPKLLRALEERTVTPVGDDRTHPLDIRVIAATHRDLRERINAGRFRGDLYFRLHVISLHIPALRERTRDIRLLADHFYRELTGLPAPANLLADFEQRDWAGNVRELRAAVERAVVLGDEPDLDAEIRTQQDASPLASSHDSASSPADRSLDPSLSFREAREIANGAWEARYLTALIARHQGNMSSAARAARMDRNHLRMLLRRHNIPYGRQDKDEE
jgi:DNA-binding NtrC family response regulator